MKYIRPITDLRRSNEISRQAHVTGEPIFITKNGYGDLVILSHELYCSLVSSKNNNDIPANYFNKESLVNHEQSQVFGLVKVASATIDILVSDVEHNAQEIIKKVHEAAIDNCSLLVLSELCLSGYTCQDLFLQETLLTACEQSVSDILIKTSDDNTVFTFGAPMCVNNKIYNTAITAYKGKILGIVPKMNIPNYHEFYEGRHFSKGDKNVQMITYANQVVPFGSCILFQNTCYQPMTFAIEICEDLWVPNTPSTEHALAGAHIICNLSASNEIVGKKEYRQMLVKATSARLISAYIYSSSGNGESTTDLVFSSHNMIAENGTLLNESETFKNQTITSIIDLEKISNERKAMNTYPKAYNQGYYMAYFTMPLTLPIATNYVKTPFIPNTNVEQRVHEIFSIQVMGLYKRLIHTNTKTVVIGLSGGLDSTLALLVAVETFKKLNYPLSSIHCLTLPCFGTSSRTKNNAFLLAEKLGVSIKEINIEAAVRQHFCDIEQDENKHDVTYENAQARERTQVLMDYANKNNGLVIGTGDLSELALGWATYNGDHMSNYGVNASIPKTLVRYLVKYYALEHLEVKDTLLDIVDTPVSPELLPTENGQIAQKTENLIGPYELHDFFLFHLLRNHFSIKKIYYLTCCAFQDDYDKETIKKWLTLFIKRFFTQQFKRSCLPDGVKVGSVSLSPRGDLRMPSDASYKTFLKELEELE